MTVLGLINQSYVLYANGRLALPGGRFVPIEKGPAWINSDRYTIEAKPEGTPSQGTMLGPMMQALLEERFKLKIHTETREVPVYNLVVTKGGPRLTMSRPGSCLSFDIEHPLPPPKPGQSLPPICGMARIANMGFEMYGATMPELGVQLSRGLGRDIIDKTGIAGTYDIQVALEPGAAGVFSPPPPPPPPPGGGGSQQPAPDNQPDTTDSFLVAQAIAQKLGLRLDSAKGPGPVLFIDHVEKPSEN